MPTFQVYRPEVENQADAITVEASTHESACYKAHQEKEPFEGFYYGACVRKVDLITPSAVPGDWQPVVVEQDDRGAYLRAFSSNQTARILRLKRQLRDNLAEGEESFDQNAQYYMENFDWDALSREDIRSLNSFMSSLTEAAIEAIQNHEIE